MASDSLGVDPQVTTGTVRRRRPFSGPPVHLSWSAILGGVIVAIAVWALLYAFGLAVGLSSIDPSSPSSLRASGIFTGIWSLIVPIVALFVGGAVASRASSDVWTRAEGGLHGLVVWGLVTLAGAWLITGVLSSVLGGAGVAAMAGSNMLRDTMSQGAYSTQGYDQVVAEALRPMNQRLAAEGKPQVRPEDVGNAASMVIQDAVRDGELNRESLVTSITRSTPLARADAEDLASRMSARFESAKGTAQTAALRAADATGKAFWGVFGGMFLGLLAALAGSTIGVAKRQRTYGSSPSTLEARGAHT